ncbi:MAG: AI-2E family transporter [Thermoguttaceae bacterium]|nr:AI-2E family transporter [Thermoguttaceae bacterium]
MSDTNNDPLSVPDGREPAGSPPQEPLLTGQRRLANYGIIAISIIAILTGIHLARSVLTPIFIAAFFAVILYSFYAYMRERGIFGIRFSRIGAVTVITCVVFFFSMVLTMVLTTQLSQFSRKFPSYWNSFSEAVIKSNDALMKRNIELKEIFDFIPFLEKKNENAAEPPALTQETVPALPAPDGAAEPAGETENGDESLLSDDGENALSNALQLALLDDDDDNILPPTNFKEAPEKMIQVSMKMIYRYLIEGLGKLMSFVSMIFLVVLLLVFMLVEAIHLPEKVKAAIGDKENERVISTVVLIRKYMTIKTVVSAVVAVLVMTLLLSVKIEYWALWGLLAFFLNFIPNIGSFVAAIPPCIIALADKGGWTALVVVVGYVLINCIVGYVLEPKLLGDGLGISALVVLLSLIIWGALLGSVGMFLSPPLAVICKIILSQFDETRWIAVLMANRPPAPPKQKTALPPPAPAQSPSD